MSEHNFQVGDRVCYLHNDGVTSRWWGTVLELKPSWSSDVYPIVVVWDGATENSAGGCYAYHELRPVDKSDMGRQLCQ